MLLIEDHTLHSLYAENPGMEYPQPPVPNPPKEDLTLPLNTYHDVPEEPRFNPKVHLRLEKPDYVRMLPNFKKTKHTPAKTTSNSMFGYSSPFQASALNNNCFYAIINSLCAGVF